MQCNIVFPPPLPSPLLLLATIWMMVTMNVRVVTVSVIGPHWTIP